MERNAILGTLIRENPMYKKMTPEEVLGKFLIHEMMVTNSKYIDNITQGNTSIEPQAIALKATNEKKEETPSKKEQIEGSELDEEEMTLFIKSFKQIMRVQKDKGKYYKPQSKKNCYNYGKSGHFIVNCQGRKEREGKKI